MEGEKKFEQQTIPEYSFEEGVKQGLALIMERLKDHSFAVVAFSASNMHVGKSKLSSEIANNLYEKGIPACVAHDAEELEASGEQMMYQIKNYGNQGRMDQEKMVFIFDQMNFGGIPADIVEKTKDRYDKKIQAACKKLGYDIDGVDLWIGIYRPDKPFGKGQKLMADMLVRNTEARDK